MNNEINVCYRILDLEPGASMDQVKQAWRFLVKVWHPDRFPNDPQMQVKAQERLKQINRAYHILGVHLNSSAKTEDESSGARKYSQGEDNDGKNQNDDGKLKKEAKPKSKPAWGRFGSYFLAIFLLVGFGVIMSQVLTLKKREPSLIVEDDTQNANPVGLDSKINYKELDGKNGFKNFKFGMSMREARAVIPPTKESEMFNGSLKLFEYNATPINLIGDYPVDSVVLIFFSDKLCRINVTFSAFPDEIFEACKINYGQPSLSVKEGDTEGKVKTNIWNGNIVHAAIFAAENKSWDSLSIENIAMSDVARDYVRKEPERMAVDFSASGFKSLIFGMELKDVSYDYDVADDSRMSAVTSVSFKRANWQAIGNHPLTAVTADFFKGKLFRINLFFDTDPKEIFDSFSCRFGEPQSESSWSRGSKSLIVKSSTKDNLKGVILGEEIGKWDTIQIIDLNLFGEAEKFKNDAPNRAAKDF